MNSSLINRASNSNPELASKISAPVVRFEKSVLAAWSAVTANVIWGASFLASKVTLGFWTPLEASSLRFILATILLGTIAAVTRNRIALPKDRQTWGWALLAGAVGFGALYPLQLIGLTKIPSGVSAIVMQSSPILVLVFAFILSREKMTARSAVAVGLATFASMLLILNRGLGASGATIDTTGLILTTLASVALALSVPISKKLSASIGSLSATFWSMAIGAALLATITLAAETPNIGKILAAPSSAWAALLFLSLICSALGFFLWNFAIRHSNSSVVAYTMQIKTPTAVLIGFTLGSEIFGLSTILAGVLFGIGSWLALFKPKAKS
jgi:probable blue pigment (indigoidine) exporter